MLIRTLTLLFLLCAQMMFSQMKLDRKTITTTRIINPPKLDGILDDEVWKNAEIANNFVVFRPDNGVKVKAEYGTEVRIVYDDDAIYISAKMLDPNPKEIPMEFATRDNFSQADFFLATINPNDDGQNPFEFVVQSTGNQGDSKVSNGNEDFNWSAVWESAAKIHDYGWAVDINSSDANKLEQMGLMQTYGFHRPLLNWSTKNEPWHVEPYPGEDVYGKRNTINNIFRKKTLMNDKNIPQQGAPSGGGFDANIPQGIVESAVGSNKPVQVLLAGDDIDKLAIAFGEQLKKIKSGAPWSSTHAVTTGRRL